VIGPLLALLLLNVIHVPMRTLFMIAVVPGAIAVAMLMLFLIGLSNDIGRLEGQGFQVR